MEGLSCNSKLIRHNIEARPDREKSLAAELLAKGLGRLVCSCVFTCVLHTLPRPAFSHRDPEFFKDFKAQGPRSLLRCFTDHCCLVKALKNILSSLFVWTRALYANAGLCTFSLTLHCVLHYNSWWEGFCSCWECKCNCKDAKFYN